jgi:xylose dehydrogenase (NAD/NADP)
MSETLKTPIRWGILSCSNIAKRRWIPALFEVAEAKVSAIASRSYPKASQWAKELNIPQAYGSYEELLDNSEIDAIYIGLPNAMHHDWTTKSLKAGKHVLCDKPLCLNTDQATDVVRVAEQQKKICVESFMYQYHELYNQIDDWIDLGKIGTLKKVQATFAIHFDRPGDFRYDPKLGGGALLDIGCYCVHVIRKITGQMPRSVRAFNLQHKKGCDWTTAASLHFQNDLIGLMDCSFDYHADQNLSIVGTGGHFDCNCPFAADREIKLSLTTLNDSQTLALPHASRFARCIQDFHKKINHKKFTPSPAHDAVANLKVLDAIAQAARSGREVSL